MIGVLRGVAVFVPEARGRLLEDEPAAPPQRAALSCVFTPGSPTMDLTFNIIQ